MCDLKEWFRSLTKDEKQELDRKFENSPVAGKLIKFLVNNLDEKFSNRDVIRHVYADEFSYDNLPKLNNRFAKLKKKVIDSIGKHHQAEHLLTKEEQKLFRARSFLENQKYLLARKLLIALQKDCEHLHILELLPEVLSVRITVEQRIDPFNTELHAQLCDQFGEAVEYEYQFRKLWHLITVGFNTSENTNAVVKHLKAVKQICAQFPNHPRFQAAYHYASVMRGVDARNVKRANAISRHFNELEQLLEQNPGMPVLHYKPNHEYNMRLYSIPQLKAYFFYYKLDFEEAYQQIELVKAAAGKSEAGENALASSEASYMNEISFCVAAKRYRQALDVVDELAAFHRQQKKNEHRVYCHLLSASIYANAYPQIRCPNTKELLQELKSFRKSMPEAEYNGFFATHFWSIASFQLISGEFDDALQALRMPIVQGYFGDDIYAILEAVFKCSIGQQLPSSDLELALDKALFNAVRPHEHLALEWAKRFLASAQRNL